MKAQIRIIALALLLTEFPSVPFAQVRNSKRIGYHVTPIAISKTVDMNFVKRSSERHRRYVF